MSSTEIVEVQRSDLVSSFVGDTAKKTEECIKKAFGKIMFIDEAYTLTSKSEKDYGKEAVETIMRYMLPSEKNLQHPVFIFAGYSSNMDEFLNLNRGLHRRIKQRFVFKDYSPNELSKIVVSKLLKNKARFPYGIEEMIADCFVAIPLTVRADFNASLCQDLIDNVVAQQEARLTLNATYMDVIKYTREDFKEGVSILLSKFKRKTSSTLDRATQTSEVLLNIPGVGIVHGSPF